MPTIFILCTLTVSTVRALPTRDLVAGQSHPKITNIANGDTLSGNAILKIAFSGTTDSNNFGLLLDGHIYRRQNRVPPYNFFRLEPPQTMLCFLETDYFPNDSHMITILDSHGNQETRQVKFANACALPRFRIIGLCNGMVLQGEVRFTVAVFDGSYADDVVMRVDGVDYGPSDVYPQPVGYSQEAQNFNTKAFPNGSHVPAITDAYGNSDQRTIVVKNTRNSNP